MIPHLNSVKILYTLSIIAALYHELDVVSHSEYS